MCFVVKNWSGAGRVLVIELIATFIDRDDLTQIRAIALNPPSSLACRPSCVEQAQLQGPSAIL